MTLKILSFPCSRSLLHRGTGLLARRCVSLFVVQAVKGSCTFAHFLSGSTSGKYKKSYNVKVIILQLAIVEMKIKAKMAPIQQCIQSVHHLTHNVKMNAQNAKAGVKDQIAKYKKMLDAIEDKLLREINAEACKKSAVLEGQAKELDAVIERFQTACSFANKTVQYANDVEMMLATKFITSRLVKLGQTEVYTEPKSDDKLRYDASPMEDFEKCLDGGFLGKVTT